MMLTRCIVDAEKDADMKNLSRKEAAKVLEGMKVKIEIPKAAVTQWKRNTALDMAIEALKYSGIPNSSDTISRQAAIEAIQKLNIPEDMCVFEIMSHIEVEVATLPAAQPEIIHCRDCRWRKDQSGSTEWLPCRAIVTPSDFYCGRAERRTDG